MARSVTVRIYTGDRRIFHDSYHLMWEARKLRAYDEYKCKITHLNQDGIADCYKARFFFGADAMIRKATEAGDIVEEEEELFDYVDFYLLGRQGIVAMEKPEVRFLELSSPDVMEVLVGFLADVFDVDPGAFAKPQGTRPNEQFVRAWLDAVGDDTQRIVYLSVKNLANSVRRGDLTSYNPDWDKEDALNRILDEDVDTSLGSAQYTAAKDADLKKNPLARGHLDRGTTETLALLDFSSGKKGERIVLKRTVSDNVRFASGRRLSSDFENLDRAVDMYQLYDFVDYFMREEG